MLLFEPYQLDYDRAVECWRFSQASTNNYDQRGQDDPRKIAWDAFVGKVGEWVAFERLRPYFPDLSYPDMLIYKKKQKGWSSDLKNGDLAFAVKSCTNDTVRSCGMSWVFQRKDAKGRGTDLEIYGESAANKLIVGVHVMFSQPREGERLKLPIQGRIMSLIPLEQIKRLGMFQPPKKENLQGYKDVVYYAEASYRGFGSGKVHTSVKELVHSKAR